MHRLLVVSVLFVLATAAMADPDVPLDSEKPPTPAPEAAKRYYAPPPKAEASAAEMRKIADEQYKQCLNDWDAATHMTKNEWKRTCRRVVDGRVKFRLEMRE
jgi:hypothetical protein